jgi:hypothetical protein
MARRSDELGFRFYAWMACIVIAGGIAGLILMLIFSRAVYAWGLLGAFFALAVVLLAFGWLYDRRQEREIA